MKLKFHWGWGIGIFYSAFALTIIIIVILSLNHNPELVDKNYYNKEIAYQEQIDKIIRTNKLPNDIKIIQTGNFITLNFPVIPQLIGSKGVIKFFRPSDVKMDFSIPLYLDSSFKQVIPVETRAKGLWKIIVDWNAQDSLYYLEQNIFLK